VQLLPYILSYALYLNVHLRSGLCPMIYSRNLPHTRVLLYESSKLSPRLMLSYNTVLSCPLPGTISCICTSCLGKKNSRNSTDLRIYFMIIVPKAGLLSDRIKTDIFLLSYFKMTVFCTCKYSIKKITLKSALKIILLIFQYNYILQSVLSFTSFRCIFYNPSARSPHSN
jgi:hypothetical protein